MQGMTIRDTELPFNFDDGVYCGATATTDRRLSSDVKLAFDARDASPTLETHSNWPDPAPPLSGGMFCVPRDPRFDGKCKGKHEIMSETGGWSHG